MERLLKTGVLAPVHSRNVTSSPIGLGFEKLDRDVFDPEKAYDKVGELGVKWIRIQSGWQRTEKAPGVYDFAWLDSIVDNLLLRGLTPWICLCYGNPLYDEAAAKVFGAVGCPPIKNDIQKTAWHNYVSAVTAHYRGKVEWFEIWNEPDGVWCWKHGPSGAEYGEFAKGTAAAIRAGNPEAKVIGGCLCLSRLNWLAEVFATGAAASMDALSYHAYSSHEEDGFNRVASLRALCKEYNPALELIQGETGTQSRSDGAGALRGGAWTEDRQARFLLRHMVADLMDNVKFASYFSCVDMIEALNGTVGDKASYLDYGYFGVLGAEFDADGRATGDYRPKPSYRALQVIAAVFREEFSLAELPVLFLPQESGRVFRREDAPGSLLWQGFRRPDGNAAFAYWRPTELLSTSYESTITLEVAALPSPLQLVDLMDGSVYTIPETMIEKCGNSLLLKNLPLKDYPLLLTFGGFVLN